MLHLYEFHRHNALFLLVNARNTFGQKNVSEWYVDNFKEAEKGRTLTVTLVERKCDSTNLRKPTL
jgi:hypothetical protein